MKAMTSIFRSRLLVVLLGTPLLLLGCSCGQDEEETTAAEETPVAPIVDSGSAPEAVTPRTSAPEPVAPRTRAPAASTATPEPEERFVLPPLYGSDPLVRQQASGLTSHPLLSRYLSPRDLIAKFVVLVENIGKGAVPRQHLQTLGTEGSFEALQMGEDTYVLDESSYARFNPVVELFRSVDTSSALTAYGLMRPLFQEAYDQLGNNDSFESAISRAIDHLLAAPVINHPIRLKRSSVMYQFDDADLENLSSAQKQLIRMGPNNTRRIQEKLREFQRAMR